MAKSHILFTSECQVKAVEERQKKTRHSSENPESYWTIKDHTDTVYLAFKAQIREINKLLDLMPDNPDRMSPPVKLEGYVSTTGRGLFLNLLRVLVWDSDAKTYKTPENTFTPPENDCIDAETEELERLHREQWGLDE